MQHLGSEAHVLGRLVRCTGTLHALLAILVVVFALLCKRHAEHHTLDQWTGLEVFLTDGRVEIDNNTVENATRPTVVGKKNWFFVGEAGAGERMPAIYTIIESCLRRGINPLAYLRDALDRLPSRPGTPHSSNAVRKRRIAIPRH